VKQPDGFDVLQSRHQDPNSYIFAAYRRS
jgi:hypothetical protein